MKNLKLSIIALTIATCMVSCLDSTHNDEANKHYMAATTLIKDKDGQFVFMADDSLKLIPDEDLHAPDSIIGSRVFINFQIKEQSGNERLIYLTSEPQMMISDPIRKDYDNIKLVGNDEIQPTMIWFSGKYINMLGNIFAGGKFKHDYHIFEKSSEGDSLILEFRHENNNDPKNMEFRQAFSYDINEYLKKCKKDTLVVSLKIKMPKNPSNPNNNQEDIVILCPTHNNTKGFSALK